MAGCSSHPGLLRPPPAWMSHLARAPQDPPAFALVTRRRLWLPGAALWEHRRGTHEALASLQSWLWAA